MNLYKTSIEHQLNLYRYTFIGSKQTRETQNKWKINKAIWGFSSLISPIWHPDPFINLARNVVNRWGNRRKLTWGAKSRGDCAAPLGLWGGLCPIKSSDPLWQWELPPCPSSPPSLTLLVFPITTSLWFLIQKVGFLRTKSASWITKTTNPFPLCRTQVHTTSSRYRRSK